MITVCREFADPSTHQFVTELIDSFGKRNLVQTNILESDHAPAVAEASAQMYAREQAFIIALKEKHGFSPAQIQALQKQPKDCGCP